MLRHSAFSSRPTQQGLDVGLLVARTDRRGSGLLETMPCSNKGIRISWLRKTKVKPRAGLSQAAEGEDSISR
jgi:hypothetical protein